MAKQKKPYKKYGAHCACDGCMYLRGIKCMYMVMNMRQDEALSRGPKWVLRATGVCPEHTGKKKK